MVGWALRTSHRPPFFIFFPLSSFGHRCFDWFGIERGPSGRISCDSGSFGRTMPGSPEDFSIPWAPVHLPIEWSALFPQILAELNFSPFFPIFPVELPVQWAPGLRRPSNCRALPGPGAFRKMSWTGGDAEGLDVRLGISIYMYAWHIYMYTAYIILYFPKQCGHTEGFLRWGLRPGVLSRCSPERPAFSL